MSDGPEPAAFVVHSLAHLRAALAAGAASGRPVVALSAPGASAFAGPAWFAAMVKAARDEFPEASFTPVIDCGDRAGDVLNALDLGLRHVIFTGSSEAAARLEAIAAGIGATVTNRRPEAFDLLNIRDAGPAALKWCENLRRPERFGM